MLQRRRSPLLLALSLSWWVAPSPARAGNDDGILVGGYASLTAGAVTATISDGTASWYNPAGLALASSRSLDLNASAYGISRTSANDLFTLPDGTHSGASVIDWQLIPSALCYTRKLSDRVIGAFSIVIPQTNDIDLRTTVSQGNGTQWVFGIDNVSREYDYIASVGVRVTDAFRVGASLSGIYISSETMAQVGVGRPGVQDTSFLLTSSHRTTGDYGLRVAFGLQWSPTKKLDFGLSTQLPSLTAFRRVDDNQVSGAVLGDETSASAQFDTSSENRLLSPWEFSTPWSLRAGAAYTFGRAQLLVDGSLYSAIKTGEIALDRKWMGNARLATLVTLSEQLAFGLGAFTDLNGTRDPGANFVGLAGGVRISTHYHLVEGARLLTFFTTLGGRYAYGWGHIEGISFEGEDEAGAPLTTKARVNTHEAAFNLGGGVTF